MIEILGENTMVDSYVLKIEYDKVVTERDVLLTDVEALNTILTEALTLLGYPNNAGIPLLFENQVADLLKETVLNLEQSVASLTEQRDQFLKRYLDSQNELLALKETQKQTEITIIETNRQLGVGQEKIKQFQECVERVKRILEAKLGEVK